MRAENVASWFLADRSRPIDSALRADEPDGKLAIGRKMPGSNAAWLLIARDAYPMFIVCAIRRLWRRVNCDPDKHDPNTDARSSIISFKHPLLAMTSILRTSASLMSKCDA